MSGSGSLAQIVSPEQLSYSDISGSFAVSEIEKLTTLGIMSGTKPDMFEPKRKLTRAEALVALMRLMRLQPISGGIPAFTDVASSDWYYGYIQAGNHLGLSQGTGGSSYSPKKGLTRQEAAVWLTRFLKQASGLGNRLDTYADAGKVAIWAAPSVNTTLELGLMQGSGGRFRPTDPVTREELAMILVRIVNRSEWWSQTQTSVNTGIQLGWQYGLTTEQYKQFVQKSQVNVLSPRWYFLQDTGTVSDNTDPELISWAKSTGRQIWPLVGNRFNAEVTHKVLSDSAVSSKLAASLAELADKYDLDGLNLDFENMLPADRSAFSNFVADLGSRLRAAGRVLSVDVPPDLGTDWSDPYDYSALGMGADYVVLMGYDEHWTGGPKPGSVASLSWVTTGVNRLIQKVKPNKVILGAPFYTRDWKLTSYGGNSGSEELTLTKQNQRINSYGLRPYWSTTYNQYVTSYVSGGATHRIWLEEARSLTLKYQLFQKKGLIGMAYWHTGGESSDVWPALNNAARFGGYQFK